MQAIGIDIGGTKIAGALVADDGEIVAEERCPTPAGDADAIVEAVVAMVERISAETQVAAVGVAAAGFIDSPSRRSTTLPISVGVMSRFELAY